jgi:hypothetical protein
MDRVINSYNISEIKKWTFESIKKNNWKINTASFGRRYMLFEMIPQYNEMFSLFNIKSEGVETLSKCFIGNHYEDGSFTHEHLDKNQDELIHTRINVMIKKPPIGGNPIISGKELQVNEGDIWLVFAGKERHASTPIYGGERVILSYGGLIKESYYEQSRY